MPGVSGSVLAISMGIYEKAIDAIANFTKDIKNNFKFIIKLSLGLILAIFLTSKIIIYFLNNHYTPTMALFLGLIFGGIPVLFKKIDYKKLNIIDFIILILSFILVFLLSLVGKQHNLINLNNNILYFLIGMIDSITTIVPGISGTALMMLLGCYDTLLELMANPFNLSKIFPFIFGIILTSFIVIKIMDYLFKKKPNEIYSGVIGFTVSSLLTLILTIDINIISICFFFLGFIISLKKF